MKTTLPSSLPHRAWEARLALVAVLSTLTAGSPARAGEPAGSAADPADVRRARELFEQGTAERKNHHAEAACKLFEQSLRLSPRTSTRLNLGVCHAETGDSVRAYRELAAAGEELAADTSGAGLVKERRRLVAEQLESLASKVARVQIVLPDRAARTSVQLDGASLPPAAFDSVYAIEPGTHTLRVERATSTWESVKVLPAGGGVVRWEVASGRDGDTTSKGADGAAPSTAGGTADGPSPSSSAAATVSPEASHRAWPPPTGTLAFAGVSAVSLVAAAVLGGLSMDARGTVQQLCPGSGCGGPGVLALRDQRSMAVGADLAFGLGGAALAVSAVIWIVGASRFPSADKARPLDARILVSPGLGRPPALGVGVTGHF